MKVKRYEGKSEEVLLPIIEEEMGPGATIISVKEKPPTGFFSFLKKPTIIITAACENEADLIDLLGKPQRAAREVPDIAPLPKPPEPGLQESGTGQSDIEESMNLLLQEARKAANQMEQEAGSLREKKRKPDIPEKTQPAQTPEEISKYRHSIVQMFYDIMLSQEVLPEVASDILRSLEAVDESSQIDVKLLMKSVYGGIVNILKEPMLIDTEKGESQTVVFMGPTGVGKTTTIAKLSSILALRHDLKVGLITADTYRIAAVEQLRTYADILGLEIRVVYAPHEMKGHLAELSKKCDVVLVDTAGRSHRDSAKMEELREILAQTPKGCKNYLVLCVTTRYADLCKTVSAFGKCADFDLIFTKLDESETLGSLLNICKQTGKKAAYVTFGQNVPDDLEAIKPDKIAKSVLDLDSAGYGTHSAGEALA